MALNTDSTDYLTVRRLWSIMSSFKDKIVTALGKKADKSSTVSNVAWSSSKLTKTINGTTTDVVSASTLKSAMSLNNVTNDAQVKRSEMGTASGVATLDANGIINTSQLPSYVDDVLEYSAKSQFPATGETGKIYVDTSTNITWRWSGTTYVEISPSLALGETSSTAYRGDRGKTAYDHSQLTSGNPHNVTATDVKAVRYDTNAQGLTDTQKSNARTNIGLGTAAVKDVPSSGNASTTQVVMGNDSRLTDSRTPTSHNHGNIANGGTLTDTAAAAATDDLVVIRDASDNKIQTSTIKGTDVADAVSKKHGHSTLTLSTTAQAYDGTHTLALPSTDPYTSARTPASHTHGNITNAGTLNDTAAAAAGNDYVVIRDADNAKIQTSTIKGTDVADAVSKKHSHSTLTLSTTAQAYDGSHTLALPSTDPYTSARTPASHTHGNITNGGALQTNDITIASGDKLVVTDSSDSNKVARTSVSFDGSTTTTALTPKGTFETFSKLTIGTTSTTAAAGNHTHTTSIAEDTGTATVTLAHNKIYKLTSGGTSVIFKTPTDSDANTIPSAYCETASGTAAKTASCTNYTAMPATYLHVLIRYTNTSTSALTLNVNGQGAKPIYINDAVSSSSNYTLPAGTYIAYYDGTNYWLRTDGKLQAAITGTAGFADAVYNRSNQTGDGWFKLAETTLLPRTNTDNTAIWDVALAVSGGGIAYEKICLDVRFNASGDGVVSRFVRTYEVDWTGSVKFAVLVSGQGGSGNTQVQLWAWQNQAWRGISIRQAAGSNWSLSKFNSSVWTYYSGNTGGTSKPVADATNHISVTDSTNVHMRAASFISTGTLPVARGGTGIATSTNVNAVVIGNSTTATNAMQTVRTGNGAFYATAQDAKPQFGTLPAAQGGTGKTSAKDACNSFINALDTGSSTPVDADYYVSQYVSGGTTTTTYHRRPMSALWTYIKGKMTSATGVNISGNATSATTAQNYDTSTGTIKTALDNKADKVSITGATKCKITYNAQGIVTAGADLAASDIPNLPESKITTKYDKLFESQSESVAGRYVHVCTVRQTGNYSGVAVLLLSNRFWNYQHNCTDIITISLADCSGQNTSGTVYVKRVNLARSEGNVQYFYVVSHPAAKDISVELWKYSAAGNSTGDLSVKLLNLSRATNTWGTTVQSTKPDAAVYVPIGGIIGNTDCSQVTNANYAWPALPLTDTGLAGDYYIATTASNTPNSSYNFHIHATIFKNNSGYRITQIAVASAGSPVGIMYIRSGASDDGTTWSWGTWEAFAKSSEIPVATTTTPKMDGTAAIGSETKWAKGDHVHPTDTSRAPTSHASSATTYGVGTTANYGHVKLDNSTPLTVGTTSSDGVATGKAHIHNALESVARASVTTADLAHINTNTRAHMILSQITSQTSTTHDPGDGYMLSFMWDNTGSYDAQLFIPDAGTNANNYGRLKIRYNNNSAWGDWEYLPPAFTATLLTSADDLNTLKGDGFGNILGYRWESTSTPTHTAFSDNHGAQLLVFGTSGSSYATQIEIRSGKGIYQRRLVSDVWGNWEKVITSGDLTLYDARRHHTNESGSGWGKIAEWTGDISGNSLTAEWNLFVTTRGTRWTSTDGVINLNIYGGNASDIPQIGTFDVVCTEDIGEIAKFALVVTGTSSACNVQLYAYANTYTSITIAMTGNGKVAANAYKTGWTYTDSTGGGVGKPTADTAANKYVYDPHIIYTGILHEGIGRKAVYWLGTDNTSSSAPGWVKFATVKKLDGVDYQGFRLSGYYYYNQGNQYATANASRFHFQAVFNATNSTAKIFYGPTNMSVSSAIRIVKVAESPLTWELQVNFGVNNSAYAVYASYEGNPNMLTNGAIKIENSVSAGSAAIGDPAAYEKDGRWDSAYSFSTDTSVGASDTTVYRVLGVNGTSANYYKPALLPYLKMEGSTTYGNVLSVGNSSGTTAHTDRGRVFLADGAGHSMKIGSNTLTENRDIFFPNASGTVALQNGTYSGMTVGSATTATHLANHGYVRLWASGQYDSTKPYALLAEKAVGTTGNWGYGQLFKMEVQNRYVIFKIDLRGSSSSIASGTNTARIIYGHGFTQSEVNKAVVVTYTYTANANCIVRIYSDLSLTAANWQRVSLRQLDNQAGDQCASNGWDAFTYYQKSDNTAMVASVTGTVMTNVFNTGTFYGNATTASAAKSGSTLETAINNKADKFVALVGTNGSNDGTSFADIVAAYANNQDIVARRVVSSTSGAANDLYQLVKVNYTNNQISSFMFQRSYPNKEYIDGQSTAALGRLDQWVRTSASWQSSLQTIELADIATTAITAQKYDSSDTSADSIKTALDGKQDKFVAIIGPNGGERVSTFNDVKTAWLANQDIVARRVVSDTENALFQLVKTEYTNGQVSKFVFQRSYPVSNGATLVRGQLEQWAITSSGWPNAATFLSVEFADNCTNAHTVDGFHISVLSTLPGSYSSDTIYFV